MLFRSRKLLQDTQYHTRKTEYDAIYMQMKMEKEAVKTYRVLGDSEKEKESFESVSVSL